jgi:phosphohistidine phosphatase
MRLFVVRHGEALARGGGERSLTPRGEIDADAAGELLAEEGIERLLHSPKLRTRQTASRILGAVGVVRTDEESSLLPPSDWQSVADAVERTGAERVVLVSHLPLVAELVGWFSSGRPADYPLPGFPSGGIVALDMDICGRGMAEIAWYAFPPGYRRESPR